MWDLSTVLLFIFFIASKQAGILTSQDKLDGSPRIKGGLTAKIGEFPSFVKVMSKTSSCGGVILEPDVVLTAANCIKEGSSYNVTTAIYQVPSKAAKKFQTVPVGRSCLAEGFENYSPRYSTINDYAILILETHLDMSKNVQAASISGKPIQDDSLVTTVGLGTRASLRKALASKEPCPREASFTGNVCFHLYESSTEPGDAGNPFYIQRGRNWDLVAINNGDFGSDIDITWAADISLARNRVIALIKSCRSDTRGLPSSGLINIQ